MVMQGLLAAHPLGAVLLLTCAGIGCALAAAFFASACRAEPRFAIQTTDDALTLRAPSRKDSVERLASLSISRLWFWNAGHGILRPSASADAFGIRVSGGVELRSWRVVKVSNPENGFDLGGAPGGFLPIRFGWAGRGEGVEIEILHTPGELAIAGAERWPEAPTLGSRRRATGTSSSQAAPFGRRAKAAAIDAGVIVAALLISVVIHRAAGGVGAWRGSAVAAYLALLAFFAIVYGALLSILEIDSVGTRRAGLRLVAFDGTPAGPRDRAMRLLGKVLGIAGFGFGLAWTLLDPGRLPWHDRVSRTFPATSQGATRQV